MTSYFTKTAALSDVTLCIIIDHTRRFGVTICLHLLGTSVSEHYPPPFKGGRKFLQTSEAIHQIIRRHILEDSSNINIIDHDNSRFTS
jgi:hypothetical protein